MCPRAGKWRLGLSIGDQFSGRRSNLANVSRSQWVRSVTPLKANMAKASFESLASARVSGADQYAEVIAAGDRLGRCLASR